MGANAPGEWRRRLMLVTDRTVSPARSLCEIVGEAIRGGANLIQLREKELSAAELFAIATAIKALAGDRATLIINDRLDVALAAGLDGVQLGSGSLPVGVARRIAPSLLIGASVHRVEEAILAERDGADYLIVGTMFPTQSHPGKMPEGLELLRQVRAAVRLPLIGIGGITEDNAGAVIEAGANGVAVITAIMAADDPAVAARRLRSALDSKDG